MFSLTVLASPERRILRQIAYAIAGAPHHLALCGLLLSGDNLHQGRLSRAVQTDDACLVFEMAMIALLTVGGSVVLA